MNMPVDPNFSELERQYRDIHARRLTLEAEFFRIEKEFKQILTEAAKLKETSAIAQIHNQINTLNS